MCAHGYDDWKTRNPADAELGPEYECSYCGEFFHPDHDNEKLERNQCTGELQCVLICDGCIRRLGNEAHSLNNRGLAKILKVAAE